MAKFQSPLLGYNNNVRHKNRIFHIQTEDSGVNHPHIITHLFMDGGRILKSVKKSYAEHVGADGMSETVRGMMKEQHKAMFIALRDGQFDELVDGSTVAKAAAPAAAPAPAAAAAAPASTTTTAAAAPPPVAPAAQEAAKEKPAPASASRPAAVVVAEAAAAPVVPTAVTAPAIPRPSAVPPPTSQPISRSEPRTEREPAPPPISAMESKPRPPPVPSAREARLLLADSEAPEPPTTTRQERAPTSQELTLDFDALERAHDNPVPSNAASLFQAADLPPPPKNLFAKELGTGAYRAVEPEGSRRPPAPTPAATAKPRPGSGRPNEGRYAPARPAAIFGSAPKPTSAPPTTPTPSIFSDDLISDKSLDEVILSYLAEDLEPPRRK